MGSKTAARKVAEKAGAPVVPGTSDPVVDAADARAVAARIGYPVMLKASAGGGGKGMRRVDSEAQLEGALRDASSEAERSFKSSEVYVEKLIERPRHIEIQVLGDQFGHVIHLGERECSLQRRHQKVVEECPSPLVVSRPGMREEMGAAAVRVAKAAGYSNAGTIEFLADDSGRFYFLEMNTRLQVEHPVTELVTGLDLVDWQLRIAAGERLTIAQEDVAWRGWALECRLYAEDPDTDFLPSPGLIEHLSLPSGPGIRLDNGVYAGWRVPMEYDPLLAKLAVWSESRGKSVDRMLRALRECGVSGIRTNIGFFLSILDDPQFREGKLNTAFIGDFLARRKPVDPSTERDRVAALAAHLASKRNGSKPAAAAVEASKWASQGRRSALR